MELFPLDAVTTNAGICVILNTQSASLVSGGDFNTAINDGNLRSLDDYKEYKGQATYCKKYIGVAKYLKRNGKLQWYSTLAGGLP